MIGRRSFVVGGAAACVAAPALAQGAWTPSKPIRLVLGYTPGGGADITARTFLEPLGRALGQTVIVDYKPGAGGSLAAIEVARAAPDGYTIGLLDNAPMTIVPALRNPGYDPLGSFTPLAMVSNVPQVLVANAAVPAKRPRELIELMKKQPGRLNFASGGNGSVSHLAAELFKARSGTFAVHVPFRGGAPAVTSTIAGETQFSFLTYASTGPFIKSGQLRAIGLGSTTRFAALPDVPTIAEDALPGYEATGWFALLGPAGLPSPIAAALKKAMAETVAISGVIARLESLGQTPADASTEPRHVITTELATWKKLVAERKLVVDA